MVRCDMEGASGVVRQEQVVPHKSSYEFGQRMLMADLSALLMGLKTGGAEEVIVFDKHFSGCNLDLARLPDFTRVICGNPPYTEDWAGGLDDSFEGVILLGFSAKCGTERGILSHSYDSDIRDLRLNGESVGAIGLEAAIAGDFNVPVVLVTGDSGGIEEATSLFPEVYCVIVKDAIGQSSGLCYPLSLTTALIQGAANQLVEKLPDVEPYRFEGQVTLEVELKEGAYQSTINRLFKDSMRDDVTMVFEGERVLDVWVDYLNKKREARTAG